jgi:hypothetical protein
MKDMPSLTLSWELTWQEEISLTTWWKSCKKRDTVSAPQLKEKSSETSRKNSATLPLTMKPNSRSTNNPQLKTSHSNSLTEMSSLLETKDSEPLNCYSSPLSLERSILESTNWPSNPSWNAISMLERIYMPTSLCPEEQPCTKELLKDSPRKSLPLLPQPWRSRSLLPLKENSLSGLVDLSSLHSVLSKLCGSPRTITPNQDPKLFTENVSEKYFIYFY